METKQCSKCGVEKALCGFGKNKNAKDGLHYYCKACCKSIREANRQKLCENKRAHYKANKEKIKLERKAYYEANKQKVLKRVAAYQRKRCKIDPTFKMKRNIGRLVARALKNQGTTKGGSTFSALPYSPQDLVEHIEKQFDEKMNWENYGSYWDLDHIYPQSLLPYSSLEDENFQKCWALENLQPLEKIANIKKSNKILDG